ncbi:MAG TPA: DMT family transporter [Gemmatimonadales bacterium]|nr:DMT family transporter [Gemmatimonadales bacterium]
MPSPRRNDVAMLAVVLIWAANFTALKVTLAEVPVLAIGAIRFVLGAVALALVVRGREGNVRFPPGLFWRLVWLGVVGNTIYQTLFMVALDRTSVANAAILLATSPLLVAGLGALTGVERLTRWVGAGLVLAFVGVLLVVGAHEASFTAATRVGDLAMLGASVCWAVFTLAVRRLPPEVSALKVTALTTITGAPGLLFIGLPDLLHLRWGAVSAAAWGGLAYSLFLSLVLAYVLWNASVKVVGPNRTAIYNCLVPLVAMLIAWRVLGEAIELVQVVGAGLIVGGVLLTRNGHTLPVPEVA